MKKRMLMLASLVGSAVLSQASIITDNLTQELNADDIGAVTHGSTWTARTGANAGLKDIIIGDLTKVAATVSGGQTSPLFSNTLNKDAWSRAGALGATPTYLTGTTLSVELWVRPNFSGTPTTSHTIFETGGATRGLSITLGDNGSGTKNTLRFAMKDASNSAFVDVTLDAAAMADFTDGHHHQLVVTYDNVNTMSLYIDGALAGSNTTAGVVDWDGTSIAGFWGQDGSGNGAQALTLDDDLANTSINGYGNGSIAVFRQYSDVLTGAEVLQNYTTTSPTYYVGSGALIDVVYNNTAGTIGSIDSITTDSWSSGLPSDSNPGLFDGTVGDGTAETATGWNVWYGVAVRQTGGTLYDTELAMRGGDEVGSSLSCTLQIDDASNTDFSTTNLAISGKLTLWKQFGTGNTLSVLNGYADVGTLACTSPADITVNILNGRLDVGYFTNAKVTVNMLAGGNGQFNLADMYGTADAWSKLDQMILNFESGSEASFTIASDNGGSAVGAWETKIAAGQVKIDGFAVTDLSQFQIADVGALGTTITLAPPPPPDLDPPTPNPAGFASQPTAISSSELWMTATVGSDASGVVEYLFTETSGSGASSGWQYSPNFTAGGLSPNTQYSYTVTMRDAFGNTGTVSSAVAATTLATDPSGPELRPSDVFVPTSGEHAGKLVRYDDAGNPVLLKAFGVNYQTAFSRYIDDVNDTSFIAGFDYLRDHNIPVARVMAAGFWPNDWNLYFTDKTEYFRRMDYFIAQAEQHEIGLILDLFWSTDVLGELVDDAVVAGYLTPGVDFVPPSPLNLDEFGAETYDEYKRAMGRPDSGSNAFIELYTSEMVERYKNSPAIWGWEFGNEYNLHVDHPQVPLNRVRWGGAAFHDMTLADSNTDLVELPAWTGPDDLVRADVLVAKANFANTVRSIDPWRLITSGDAKSMRSAYHNWTEHTWTTDSRAEHALILPVDNPAPMDTLSVHIYPGKPGVDPEIYFPDDNPVTLGWVDGQYKELLDYFMAESAALGLPLIVGEWGATASVTGTTEDEKTTFNRYMQALIDSGVQLSLLWNFDNTYLNQIDEWWVNPGTDMEYQLTNADPNLWDLEQANGQYYNLHAPVFTVDPVNEANATEDIAYSGSVANATDVDGDTLTYSKLTGPAWLSVGTDGSLSGTPLDGDVGSNSFTVQVDDGNGGTDTATLNINVDEFIVADLAVSGVQTLGTMSGTLADTYASDDVYQVLTESGDPSALEYEWTFNVLGGELVTFYVEAYHTVNSEGDDFVFAYSTNGTDYIEMGIVIDTVDDDTMVWYALPSGTSGTVTVRVMDTDRTDGNTAADSLYVDEIYIQSEDSTVAPDAANTPVPADGSVDVAIDQDLAWTAGAMTVSHDVYFGTNPAPGAAEFQGNQSGTTFDPGTLDYSTTYYWAIDEVNLTGTTAGPVWSFTTAAPAGPAIVPITSITTTSSGTPEQIILNSFTAGGILYTTATDLVTGTSEKTDGSALKGRVIGDQDNFDLNRYFSRGGNPSDNSWDTISFGGENWSNSNGDDADFFIFESGGNDSVSIRPIFTDGSVGQFVVFSVKGGDSTNWGDTNVPITEGARSGQNIFGMAFAITDLVDAAGVALTNNTMIMGLDFDAPGSDIASISAVAVP